MRPSSKLLLFAVLFVFIAVCAGAEEEEKRADEMPVLTAKSIAVTPAYPQPGESAVAVLTISNASNEAAEGVEVELYANGELLASRTVSIDAPGIATVSVPWTPKSAGRTTLVGKVDPRQVLTEGDRYDNTYALDVVTSAAPPADADFAVTAVDVLAPAESPGSIRVVVGNEGKGSGSAPLVIRRNGLAVTVVDTGVLEAGKSATIEVPWSDPDRGAISAEVNPRWAAAEPSSKNNTLAASASTQGVDLRIEQLAFHALQDEKETTRRVGINFRIVNDGAEGVTRPIRTRIDPGAVDKDGKLVPAYVTTDALPAGGTVYVSYIFEAAPEDFALTAVADADDAVKEADEKNNIAVKDFHAARVDPDRWINIGPRRITGTSKWYGWSSSTGVLSTMAIDPSSPSTMYVGAWQSGVWKTTDGGVTWAPVSDSATLRVAALALEPGTPSRVYLVTPNEGVFRSDNAAMSWTQISQTPLSAVIPAGSALLINPAAPTQMVVSSNFGVFRSDDGGVHWTLTLQDGACTSLVHRAHNGALYAGLKTTNAAKAGVYESFDWGATWHLKFGCPGGPLPGDDAGAQIRLAVSGSKLYVAYKKGSSFRLFRETSLGCSFGGEGDSSWELAFSPGADPGENFWSGLWADPTNSNNLYMTGTFIYRSTDRGSSFSRVSGQGQGESGSAHVDHHQLAFDPVTPSKMYSLDDGGIYRSTSRGVAGSWVFIGDGIANVEFYDGVAAPTNAGLMIGGTQDNGNLLGTAGNGVWSEIRAGDGATVDIDPVNSSIMYTMAQHADSIQRSANGGADFLPAANGLPSGSDCDNLHYQVHPGQPATLVASCFVLWRTTNSGAAWATLFGHLTSKTLRSAIDGPADIYYIGSNMGTIEMGPHGQNWTTIYDHPTDFAVTDLEINRLDPSRIYASFDSGGLKDGRVIRLVRNAAGTFTWQDITSDLPVGRVVQTIAIDRNRSFTVYAGTDRGVFQGRSINHGFTWFWTPYNNGMPAADVRDLEVHPTTGIMRAFTFGRSAYEVTTTHPAGDEVSQ
jgi:photosystem II stability/assembly factor-like uncharacterized protein